MTRALVIALLLALLAAVWQWREATAEGARADRATEQLAAVQRARTEESRRAVRLQEAQDAEHLARQAAQRDAAAARAAADGLRRSAADFACVPSDTGSAAGGPPAGPGPRVLPDVLGELAARADRLAEQADAARIAGQLCERAYDALTAR